MPTERNIDLREKPQIHIEYHGAAHGVADKYMLEISASIENNRFIDAVAALSALNGEGELVVTQVRERLSLQALMEMSQLPKKSIATLYLLNETGKLESVLHNLLRSPQVLAAQAVEIVRTMLDYGMHIDAEYLEAIFTTDLAHPKPSDFGSPAAEALDILETTDKLNIEGRTAILGKLTEVDKEAARRTAIRKNESFAKFMSER